MATIVTRSGKGSPLTNNEVDANFNNLNSGKAELSGATFTGEIVANAGVVVDNFTLDGTTLALSSGDFTLDVAGSIKLDADSSNIYLADGGTDIGLFSTNGQDLTIRNLITDKDINFQLSNGGTNFTALSLDANLAGAATFNAGITASNAGVIKASRADNARSLLLYTDNNNATVESDTDPLLLKSAAGITLDAVGDIILDADGGDVYFKDAGTTFLQFKNHSSTDIYSLVNNQDLKFIVRDGGNNVEALVFDAEAAGNATFSGVVRVPNGSTSAPSFSFSGDTNTGIYSAGGDNIGFAIAGSARAFISGNQFNMTGNGIFSGNGTFGGTLGVTGAATFASTIASSVITAKSSGNTASALIVQQTGSTDGWGLIPDNTNGNLSFTRIGGGTAGTHLSITNQGAATFSSTIAAGAATFTTADNLDTLSLISTDADANVAPNLRLYRNSGSPADADQLGKIKLQGKNDAGEDVDYAVIGSQILDASNGTEDGRVFINSMVNGAMQSRIDVRATETIINNESIDLDFRVESDNSTHALFVEGSSGNVLVGKTSNVLTNAGFAATPNDFMSYTNTSTSAGDRCLLLNRQSANGALLEFRKANAIAGTIGTTGGQIYLDGASGDIGLYMGTNNLYPRKNGANVNNAVDIGQSSYKFKDLYLSGTANVGGKLLVTDGGNSTVAALQFGDAGTGISRPSTDQMNFLTADQTRMIIKSDGDLLMGKTASNVAVAGHEFLNYGRAIHTVNASTVQVVNRTSNHGDISLFQKDGATIASIGSSATVFNESGIDADFRVESNNEASMFVVNGGTDQVIITNSVQDNASPNFKDSLVLHNSQDGGSRILFSNGVAAELASIQGGVSGVGSGTDDGTLIFRTALNATASEKMRINTGGVVFNEDSNDLDFRVESDGNSSMFVVDGGGNHVNIGTSTDLGGVLNVGSSDNNVQLVLYSDDADANEGPILDLWRNSANPADGDVTGVIRFRGENSADEAINYATIETRLDDVTNATEDGRIEINTMVGGSAVSRMKVDATETAFNDNSADLDFRVESDNNANALFAEGSSGVVNFGRGSSSINTNGAYILGGEIIASQPASTDTYLLRNTATTAYTFYVSSAGQIHAVQTSISSISDERLKENIVDIDTGLAEVMALKPRKFDWKEGEGSNEKNVTGFVAQEVETVLPNLIGNFKHDDLDDAKSVKMGDMVPTLVKAIQEQQTLIETLTARIAALEE